jgi:hypothetical protein
VLSQHGFQGQKELHEIFETFGLDYWSVETRDKEARTPTLEVIKREVIRGEVVSQYTVIDDLLTFATTSEL